MFRTRPWKIRCPVPRCFLAVTAAVAALGGCSSEPAPESGATRPNFVVIIADDMSWDDAGAYGHPSIRTPNIDRLAREGMRFERAFVTASSCSPSRASIITGRYPHNTGAEQLHWPLPASQVTFAEKLKQAGYWCAAVGKWHLGPGVKDRFDVVREADPAGFQLPSGEEGEASRPAMVAADASGASEWIPVMQARPRDQPFFLWLAALDPHRDYEPGIIDPPHAPGDVRVPPYLPGTPEVRADLALYYDEIARLDGYVGRVLDELEEQGVAGNTLVLFLSDNGRPFPRDKTTLYDSGVKTPWIVRWPGRVEAGSVNPQLVSTVDIAPTFLELAGLPPEPAFEGRSFGPLLQQTSEPIRDHIFAERHWHDYEAHGRAARSMRYKYIRNTYPDLPNTPPADAGRSPTFQTLRRLRDEGKLNEAQRNVFEAPRPEEELYDLESDPYELNNLAADAQYEEILEQHRQALQEWAERTGDFVPSKRTPDEFDRETGEPTPARKRPRASKLEMFGTTGKY